MNKYVIKHDDVYFEEPDNCVSSVSKTTRICSLFEIISVIYDVKDCKIHKHGVHEKVQECYKDIIAKILSGSMPESAKNIIIASFRATQEVCDLLNFMIENSPIAPSITEHAEHLVV